MQEKRTSTIKNVALLQDHLKKTQNSQLVFFGREMEGHESEKFCDLFELSKYNYLLAISLICYLNSLLRIPS